MLIEEIKNKINIIELAKSEGLLLKKQSNRIYKTKCCFHNETKASLTFYTDDLSNKKKNSFFCYACQAHGDAINFYAKRHNLSNREAIKQLASHHGLNRTQRTSNATSDLTEIDGQGKERQFKRTERQPNDIYRALQEFCGELDQEIQTYLTSESRGLTAETIKKFGIFSIKDYKKTKEFLLSRFSLERLQDLVLIARRQNRFLFSKHPIIIPVIEESKIVAIHGRFFFKGFSDPDIFKKTFTYGKYQSTAGVANRLFNSDILKTLKKGERVYLAEGEFDTMILDQHGFNAVGVLGVSNYNEDTIKRLNDFNLQICFDNDEQGIKEADKVARIFNRQTGRIAYFEASIKNEKVKDITELFIKREKDKK